MDVVLVLEILVDTTFDNLHSRNIRSCLKIPNRWQTVCPSVAICWLQTVRSHTDLCLDLTSWQNHCHHPD
jgi:hypothetical protein